MKGDGKRGMEWKSKWREIRNMREKKNTVLKRVDTKEMRKREEEKTNGRERESDDVGMHRRDGESGNK